MVDLLATVVVSGMWVALLAVCAVMLAGATSGQLAYLWCWLTAPRDRRQERAARRMGLGRLADTRTWR